MSKKPKKKKKKKKKGELVDALTNKTSPCCSNHVKHRRLCLSFFSQLKCRRFAILYAATKRGTLPAELLKIEPVQSA